MMNCSNTVLLYYVREAYQERLNGPIIS